jgi:tRNA-(ms[2]io[6]A)-hydroxylase
MAAPPPAEKPDKKRHLPVLAERDVAAADEDRPPWHWAAIAAVGVFVFWFPLILAVNAIVGAPGAAFGVLHAAAFSLASFAAGFLVARFGARTGTREASVGGAAAGGVAWLAAVTQATPREGLVPWILVLVAIVAVGGAAARAGAALGIRLRARH